MPEGRPAFGLTFSGGGFRATLAALGVVRFLADVGVLGDARFVSSVSGGSIANGVLAASWTKLRERGFTADAVDELVIDPIITQITGSSLKWDLLVNTWRSIGPRTRTDVLADQLDERFFHGRTLESLDTDCRFIVNAANLTTGARFAFDPEFVGDYVVGMVPTRGTGIRLAAAVAASAAVPGAFAPMVLDDITFPCPDRGVPRLLDGGAYDNTGLEAIDGDAYRDLFIVVMNAGGVFATGDWGGIPFIRNLVRSNALLYRQSTGLRSRWMVERFLARQRAIAKNQPVPPWGRRGIWMALASNVRGAGADEWRERHPEHRTWKGRDLAFVPTVFDKLDSRLCRLLVYRGWWLSGATIARYHPGSVTSPENAPSL
jgi:NTE family protein